MALFGVIVSHPSSSVHTYMLMVFVKLAWERNFDMQGFLAINLDRSFLESYIAAEIDAQAMSLPAFNEVRSWMFCGSKENDRQLA